MHVSTLVIIMRLLWWVNFSITGLGGVRFQSVLPLGERLPLPQKTNFLQPSVINLRRSYVSNAPCRAKFVAQILTWQFILTGYIEAISLVKIKPMYCVVAFRQWGWILTFDWSKMGFAKEWTTLLVLVIRESVQQSTIPVTTKYQRVWVEAISFQDIRTTNLNSQGWVRTMQQWFSQRAMGVNSTWILR